MKYITKFNEKNESELSITDFISYIGTDKKLLALIQGKWLEVTVVGIDIPEEKLKISFKEGYRMSYIWKNLFYQLDGRPKTFTIKII